MLRYVGVFPEQLRYMMTERIKICCSGYNVDIIFTVGHLFCRVSLCLFDRWVQHYECPPGQTVVKRALRSPYLNDVAGFSPF